MIFLVTPSTLFPFIVGKYVWLRTSVDLALIFFLLGLLFDKRGSIQIKDLCGLFKKPLVIAVTIFTIIFLLACLFGVDPGWSFWSNFERGEGGLQILHLYVFFFLLVALFKEERDWRWLFVSALIGGLGMAFYGFLAGIKSGAIGPPFNTPNYRFQGSIGNPAYVAAYAIFMLFYAGYILVSKYKNRLFSLGGLACWFLLALFLAVFFAAATRGTFVGLIAAVLVFIGYIALRSRRWRKWFIGLGIALLLAVILLVQFKDTAFIKSLPLSRIFDISFSTKTFGDRAIMWETAIEGWKVRPIFGWGPENFLKIFDEHFNIKYFKPAEGFGAWFDRAHSVYFDYLAETGILGLLSFLSIWFVFYWQFFKTGNQVNNQNDKNIRPILFQNDSLLIKGFMLAVPVAYLVQGIVLFDVLPIYMNIFMFLAFAAYKFYSSEVFPVGKQNLNQTNK